jgi:hypothetical protein
VAKAVRVVLAETTRTIDQVAGVQRSVNEGMINVATAIARTNDRVGSVERAVNEATATAVDVMKIAFKEDLKESLAGLLTDSEAQAKKLLKQLAAHIVDQIKSTASDLKRHTTLRVRESDSSGVPSSGDSATSNTSARIDLLEGQGNAILSGLEELRRFLGRLERGQLAIDRRIEMLEQKCPGHIHNPYRKSRASTSSSESSTTAPNVTVGAGRPPCAVDVPAFGGGSGSDGSVLSLNSQEPPLPLISIQKSSWNRSSRNAQVVSGRLQRKSKSSVFAALELTTQQLKSKLGCFTRCATRTKGLLFVTMLFAFRDPPIKDPGTSMSPIFDLPRDDTLPPLYAASSSSSNANDACNRSSKRKYSEIAEI